MASTTQPAQWWSAPYSERPAVGVVAIPGSKSLSNRALVLAALADGPSTLTGVLHARDTQLMTNALRALGHEILATSENPNDPSANLRLDITPHHMHGDSDIDVGLAGTVMRFVPPVAALAHGATTFDGDPHARKRPMATLIESLRDLGVQVNDRDRGTMPFTVIGTGEVRGGEVFLDASRSSQFISGLLLSSARFDAGATIHHVSADRAVPSQPHIEMTIAMLAEHGVHVHREGHALWHVDPHTIAARDRRIEPDVSNASPFFAAAMVTEGAVTVPFWPQPSLQPSGRVLQVLERMGARVEYIADGIRVSGTGAIHGVDADLSDVGEITPTIAALAVLADSPSYLSGIGHLRGHETDRLAALTRELGHLGAHIVEEPDALRISPRPLHGGAFSTYDDHRMATAAAIVGLRVPGVLVENIATTQKTLADFPGMWTSLVSGDRA